MTNGKIALELYTVRELTAKDFIGTLRQVAGIGYRAVEFAGYGGIPARELRAALDELGLEVASSHVGYNDFETRLTDVIAELKTLRSPHAVVPWLAEELRPIDRVPRLAEAFNRWGAACRAEGIGFGYHNHGFEFEQKAPDGRTMFDLLVEATDPSLVHLQLDVGWAHFVGVDPVGLIERLAGRLPTLHIKDMSADGPDAPVGEGTLDWSRILPAAAAARTEWYIVEQDRPTDPLKDSERSLRNLERLLAESRR